jgi:hypothetical protein
MKKKMPRERLNLSLDSEILDFAKKWSYVRNRPISRLVEDMFSDLKELVSTVTPEQYLHDPELPPNQFPVDENQDQVYDEWLKDEAEAEYCKKNPDSKRAKLRIALLKQREEESRKEWEEQERLEKEFIARWKETFPSK